KHAHGESGGEEHEHARDGGHREHDRDHRVGCPRLLELVDAQPPAQPDECFEVAPVHEAFSSSQVSLEVAWASAPAFSRKRSSSVPPWRIVSSAACSTSSPRTMMPTCVQSFSTISRTCEVRNTVEPRATKPESRSRITRDV